MTAEKKKQTGFILFLISITLLVLNLTAATILSAMPGGIKYAVLTVPVNLACLTLSLLGIISGIKTKFDTKPDKTKRIIGIAGNSAIVLFELVLIIGGLFLALTRHQ